jgi:hypothetical protein
MEKFIGGGMVDSGGVGCVLFSDRDADAKLIRIAHFFAEHGFVKCTRHVAGESHWVMQPLGRSHLQAITRLQKPRLVCMPREGVPLTDLSVIELHTMLEEDGWISRVKQPAGRMSKKDKIAKMASLEDATLIPQDYTVGSKKVWWMQPSQARFSATYFRALLAAREHKRPIKHFKSSEYYQALIDGRPLPETKPQGLAFDFGAERHPSPKKQRGRGSKRAATTKRAAVVLEPPADEASADDAGSAVSGDLEVDDDLGSDGPISAKSNSSSSSSKASTTMAGVPDADGTQRGRDARQEAHGPFASTTTMWHSFKFTAVKSGETHAGWEVTCYHPDHKPQCRKTLRFKKHGGIEATECLLKWWCLQANDCGSKADHTVKDQCAPPSLPTQAELDCSAEGFVYRSRPAVAPKKRRVSS